MNADEGTAETWTEAGAAGRERLGAASNLEHARLPRLMDIRSSMTIAAQPLCCTSRYFFVVWTC
jgi:hypothetical protein